MCVYTAKYRLSMKSLFLYIEERLNAPNIELEPLEDDRDLIKELLDLKWPLFKNSYGENRKLSHHKYFLSNLDDDAFENSVVARDKNTGKIVGAYIIKTVQFEASKDDLYDLNFLDEKDVYEGISLFIDPKYQGYGIGKKLINYLVDKSKQDNIPIIGSHFYSLNNLEDWLKRRKLYRDDEKNQQYHTIYISRNLRLSEVGKEYFKKYPDRKR